ncbi:MAG: AmmeMemoRadiSam system protein A [Thiobacillaceae bacterium]|nr:AmmeMemoRadiSam system protein A [Thiobacillaceae bacterium]
MPQPCNEERGRVLTRLARARIARDLGLPAEEPERPAWLKQPGAAFVTLTRDGRLRGCIGSLSARRSLEEDVEENARLAAFADPRFAPLTPEEFADTEVEVSVLSPTEPIYFTDEADALRQLRPGIDGVILEYGRQRATFLPQVWAQLPEPRDFLAHLKRKAGLPADFWHPDLKLYRYTVEKYTEAPDHAHA